MKLTFSDLIRRQAALARRPLRKTFQPRLEEFEARVTPSATNVLQYHNDAASTGQNLNETTLTPANVNSSSFGKLFSVNVDGSVFGQPLVKTSVNITTGPNQGVHNVVFVVTEHDSVYAIDADHKDANGNGIILWHDNFLTAYHGGTVTTVPTSELGNTNLGSEEGITSTPVIDPNTGTLYVLAETKEVASDGTHYIQTLHALDLGSGAEKFGGPATVADTIYKGGNAGDGNNYVFVAGASVNGTGSGSVNGKVTYNGLWQSQRAALELINGTLYIASASQGDNGPYHGWILGYNPGNLQLTAAFCDTPNGSEGGIWEAGGGIATDGTYLYVETGNGSFNTNASNFDANGFPKDHDYGNLVLKLAMDSSSSATSQNGNGWGLKPADYFAPFNTNSLNGGDTDIGSQMPLLLPDSAGSTAHPHLLVAAGKEGRIYLIDRDHMGKFNSSTDQVVEELPGAFNNNGSFATPGYFNGSFYYVNNGDHAKQFTVSNGQFNTTPASTSPDSFGYPGSSPTFSANGTTNGILWALDRNSSQLRAYDATNLSHELYTSGQAANNRDQLSQIAKFAVPTVANGDVYVGTQTQLVVYGLLTSSSAAPAAPSNLTATALSASVVKLAWTDNDVAPNQATGYSIEESTDGTHFNVVGTASAGATTFSVGGLTASTAYTFRIRAFNSVGSSAYTTPASATTSAQVGGVDFSAGFSNAASLITLNGSAALNGAKLELTNGGTGEAGSAFFTNTVDVSQFATQFSFQLTTPNADGFAFVIQGNSPTALGGVGGGLGYVGIGKSAAIKFDLWDNAGEGPDSTGLYTNGANPTTPATDLSGAGIDLHSGHVFNAVLVYDGTTLTVTITDTTTHASASQSYTVDLPTLAGSKNAYVGFTGGTGGQGVTQDILSWTYQTPITSKPAAPSNLTATANSGTQITLTWADNSSNETGFKIDRATSSDFSQNLTTINVPSNSTSTDTYMDTGLNPGVTYYYRVRATNTAGDSANSSPASATTLTIPNIPSNVTAVKVLTNEVDLAWQDNSNNEDGFKVFRKTSNSDFVQIATVAADTTSFQNTGLTAGTEYDYHIIAFNSAGNSDAAGVTLFTVSPAPTGLTVTGGQGQETLSWSTAAGAATYNVYRSTASGQETKVATGITGLSFTDTGLAANTTYYYQVTAIDPQSASPVNTAGESARSTEASGTTATASLPSPFVSADIGSPGQAGSASYANGTFTVTGGGGDIWNTGDQFQYVYQTLTGDGTIIARVASQQNTNAWAKAGVMIRDSAAANGAYAFAFTTPGNGTDFQYRTTDGGSAAWNGQANATAPEWVKLVRQGNTFTAYSSPDGSTWTVLGSTTISMGATVDIGLAVTAHNNAALSTVTFDHVSITSNSPGLAIDAGGAQVGSFSADADFSGGAARSTTDAIAVSGVANAGPAALYQSQRYGNFTYTLPGLTPNGSYVVNLHFAEFVQNGAGKRTFSVAINGSTVLSNFDVYATAGGFEKALVEQFNATADASGKITIVFKNGNNNAIVNGIEVLKPTVNFSSGFAAASGLSLNGNAAISGTALQLTDGNANEAGSAFTATKVSVARFTTRFDFQVVNPSADGFTFALQGSAATALGPTGGGLGFGPDHSGGTGGIGSSVAVKFDLYNNAGEGVNSTGLFTNGAAPTTGGTDLTGSGIDLHSGHVFRANLSYDGTTLTVKITDLSTNASATQSYSLNIASLVGGNTAFVGFTGGTGGLTATQNILNWTFTSL